MKRFLSTVMPCICIMVMTAACGVKPQEMPREIFDFQVLTDEKRNAEAERIAAIYRDACGETAQPDVMKNIIVRLGENGYTAVDSENQIDMTNADQVLAFCDAVNKKESASLTVIEVVNTENADMTATCRFRKYDFQTENGSVDVVRGYYRFDGHGNLVSGDTVSYPADLWQYTEEGYLVFEGRYFADDYYIISLTDAPEFAAFRVEPLDAECRDLYQKYIQPVGYEDNNLFLVNWTEEDFGSLDFYDLFDKFYPMVYQKPVPYTASENPGIGLIYEIAENEFEGVIGAYLNISPDALRSRTAYFSENGAYAYKPRGFYELACSNRPYPEVVCYTENMNGTITLAVNAVFPYECTSRAFSHEVVVRPLEEGGFRYVSNKIMEGDYDAWWRAGRLTDDEWEAVYAGRDMTDTSSGTDASLWYLPQAEDCLLTEPEQDALRSKVLMAAEQAGEVYRNMEMEDGPSYASNVKDFSRAQCKEVVSLLGKAGFVSVTEDMNMENYQDLISFYEEYKKGHDAMVTVYDVRRDGLIGAVTFIYKKTAQKDEIQTYYAGIGWEEGGVPTIRNTLVSGVAEMHLTEKGYFIYTYEESIIHSGANQYWRVKPLPQKCRELTGKYIAGLSFTNYNAFVTDWNSSNVEDILMPCMFEDIYRIDMGENIEIGTDWIQAEVYERIMMTYFPVSKKQLRSKCGYDADRDSYPYEMIFAVPYSPFGEVVGYTENPDKTITLFVDGVWIDYNSDAAFRSEIVVQPFADGTFRYLSNKIQPKELELPTAASYR